MGQSSAIDDSELPPEPMIPGIYNYCDRWCERCVFSRRCRVFRDVRVMEHAFERGQDRVQTLADLAVAECEEAERERSPAARAEWDGMIARAQALPTERELADVEAWVRRRDAWIDTQPVIRNSREYGRLSIDVCVPLQAMLPSRTELPEPIVPDSVQVGCSVDLRAGSFAERCREEIASSASSIGPLKVCSNVNDLIGNLSCQRLRAPEHVRVAHFRKQPGFAVIIDPERLTGGSS